MKLGQDPQPLDQGQFTAAAFFLATISIQIKNGLSFAVWSKIGKTHQFWKRGASFIPTLNTEHDLNPNKPVKRWQQQQADKQSLKVVVGIGD